MAVRTLEACLKLDKDRQNPSIIETKERLAKMHMTLQNQDEAEAYVDQVLKDSPKNVDANFIKGNILLIKGREPKCDFLPPGPWPAKNRILSKATCAWPRPICETTSPNWRRTPWAAG